MEAVGVLEYLARPAGRRPLVALPALAAHITGDTKALNHGTTLATLVLRALALRESAVRPASAAQRRELWDLSNVIADDLASRVLVLNLTADGGRPGRMADRRGPLRHSVPGDAAPAHRPPDPAFFRPGYSRARIPPCSGGPARNSAPRALRSSARKASPRGFSQAGRIAVAAGGELAYQGDFDWPAVAITANVIGLHGVRPWRMTEDDYVSGVEAGEIAIR